jgi:asparagine synthase (glutamine-hydrolysing)
MDYRLVELAARLPWHFKLGFWERKHLLKSLASRYLPREVIYRRKHGFSLPMDDWMEHSWVPLVEEVVFGNESRNRGLFSFGYLRELWGKHRSGRERHGYRFWLLLWLELWFQIVIDGTRSVSDPLS